MVRRLSPLGLLCIETDGNIIWGLHINIGNHGAYLFPEFQLDGLYKADYLLVGKSSGRFEFIFVELENLYGKITLKDGKLGAEFRDGISQLEDWKRWFPSNYSSFGEIMRKYKNSAFDDVRVKTTFFNRPSYCTINIHFLP